MGPISSPGMNSVARTVTRAPSANVWTSATSTEPGTDAVAAATALWPSECARAASQAAREAAANYDPG